MQAGVSFCDGSEYLGGVEGKLPLVRAQRKHNLDWTFDSVLICLSIITATSFQAVKRLKQHKLVTLKILAKNEIGFPLLHLLVFMPAFSGSVWTTSVSSQGRLDIIDLNC